MYKLLKTASATLLMLISANSVFASNCTKEIVDTAKANIVYGHYGYRRIDDMNIGRINSTTYKGSNMSVVEVLVTGVIGSLPVRTLLFKVGVILEDQTEFPMSCKVKAVHLF